MTPHGDPATDPPGTCRWRNPSDSGPRIKVANDWWVHVGAGGGQDDEAVASWPIGPLRAPSTPNLSKARELVESLRSSDPAASLMLEDLADAVERARELHHDTGEGYCATCGPGYHTECCGEPAWPCPTFEALEGAPAGREPIDWPARLRAASAAVADAAPFLADRLRVAAAVLPSYHPRVVEAVERELSGVQR